VLRHSRATFPERPHWAYCLHVDSSVRNGFVERVAFVFEISSLRWAVEANAVD